MTPADEQKIAALLDKRGGVVTESLVGVSFIIVLRADRFPGGSPPACGLVGACDRCAEPIVVSRRAIAGAPAAGLVCTDCVKADEECDGVALSPTDNAVGVMGATGGAA